MLTGLLNSKIDQLPEFDNHELVIFASDEKTGLRAFIGIHNTNLGPATGGTRYQVYRSDTDAVRDVLKLSRAMSYKCALADVPFGGGKAVIIGDPKHKKSNLLQAYATKIEKLGGAFSTGTDAGMTDEDIAVMAESTNFVEGALIPLSKKYSTSDMAALGVFNGIKESVRHLYKTENLSGYLVAVKGLGKLGSELVRLLTEAGVNIIAADINPGRMREIKKAFPKVKFVEPEDIHKEKCNIYAPCALGDEFNKKTVKELHCEIVCGGANNQLANEEVGVLLHDKNVLYAPDYVVNAGGLINVVSEQENGGYSKEKVMKKVEGIQRTLDRIFKLSEQKNTAPNIIADEIAHKIIYG